VGNGLIAYTNVTYPWESDEGLPVVMALNPDGTGNRVLLPPDRTYDGGTSTPRWSRDGKRLLFARFPEPGRFATPGGRFLRALWVSTASGTRIRRIRLGLGRVRVHGYDWAPDGRRIVFAAQRAGYPPRESQLYTIATDGTHRKGLRRVGSGPSWSGDGRRIVFVTARSLRSGSGGIALIRPDGTGFKRLTRSSEAQPRDDWSPSFSPDGQSVVYVRHVESPEPYGWRQEWRTVDVTGRNGVVIRTLRPLTASSPWYGPPQWRPDGERLAAVRWRPAPNDTRTAAMVTVDPESGEERVAFQFRHLPYDDGNFSWQARP
jgi:Tol biopolymer transport system component